MLKVENINTSYDVSQILFNMSLEVNDHEVVTLLGRNGMGKTTTIKSIMGLVPAKSGDISFNGAEIAQAESFRIARMGIGLVPEGRQVFPNLTVSENLIATASNRTANPNPWTTEKIFDMFPEIARRANSMANLLSGGEQQMLAIGRALMTNPKLLILDEATEGLAPLVRDDIWACLSALKKDGQSILVIDKNVRALTEIADRHYLIEKGQVVWTGTSAELSANEEIQHKYLGV
ncbi:MAG: ABC transporter ATP-binding protein [Alphaproteobacteria bacterium]|nr:ABC transporter ATP-binding protein [Alphaproteobacteria bacterium]MBT4082460.1 ABC transporter ATP-binding protein [Alphaproteobacteria bacterium]MBT4546002.1 ABC transporter ATP-binding protein [Alphaproteobacteria bacterium]MBT7743902.1 ABC transporter ATP-binding protein [Alphaproteobacteria bacterium]